jgi:phosphatidylglycerol:prolipoprotein diacylglycerol transferase
MFPYFFESLIGRWILIPTYSIFLGLAFSFAYLDALKRGVKNHFPPKNIEQLFLWVVFSAFLGGRLFHTLVEEWTFYSQVPFRILYFWEGGLTFYGGFLLSIAAVYLFCKIRKVSFLEYGDLIAPSLFLGIFFGRLGCFSAGCCWGKSTHWAWGVSFTHPEALTPVKSIPLHPVQLYEAFLCLGIYFILRRSYPFKKFTGQIFFRGLVFYSVIRFILEFYRADLSRGFVLAGTLSTAQAISILVFALSVFGWGIYKK